MRRSIVCVLTAVVVAALLSGLHGRAQAEDGTAKVARTVARSAPLGRVTDITIGMEPKYENFGIVRWAYMARATRYRVHVWAVGHPSRSEVFTTKTHRISFFPSDLPRKAPHGYGMSIRAENGSGHGPATRLRFKKSAMVRTLKTSSPTAADRFIEGCLHATFDAVVAGGVTKTVLAIVGLGGGPEDPFTDIAAVVAGGTEFVVGCVQGGTGL